MGAAFVFQRLRGVDPMQSGIGPVILLNLGISFLVPNISIGGHLGGLVGGALAAFAMEQLAQRRRGIALPVVACLVVGLLAVAGSLAVAGGGNDSIGLG
jgi:membrane associated rhomboid family serine protease